MMRRKWMSDEQESNQRPVRTDRGSRRASMLDLNVLPSRYRRPRLRWAAVAPWLSLLGLIILVYPIFQWFLTTNQGFSFVARDLDHQRATQILLETPSGTEAALRSEIAEVQAETDRLQSAVQSIDLQKVAWGDVIRYVIGQAPGGALVTQVSGQGSGLVLNGQATTYPIALVYAQRLKDSGRFVSVQVDVISQTPETSPTPTAVPTRTTRASTPASSNAPEAQHPFAFTITLTMAQSNQITPTPEANSAP
jgi:Tfp pilus assembly protein PilN